MSIFRRLSDRWIRSRLMSANYQEELDTYKIYGLLEFRKRYEEASKEERQFDKKLELMFSSVHQKGGVDPYPAPVIEKKEDEEHLSYEQIAERRLDVLTESEARKIEADIYERPLEHIDGFTMQILYSSIDHPAAGFGVYLTKGNILPGTVIGIYPGTIYTPDTFKHLNKESEYMLTGYDGLVVDADGWAESAIQMRRKLNQYSKLSIDPGKLQRYRNPYAICNYINHPPKGSTPNVMGFAYSFDDKRFPDHLRPFIPHRFRETPKWYYGETVDLRSVIVVATRVIQEGEELFLDYRYNPKFAYPDWYHPVDIEESTRRWAPTRIIF